MEKKRSIRQVSNLLGISKDTLRYYDKMALVKPQRGANEYRYYTQEDLLDLQYIEVMKYAEFSLRDISKILKNKHGCTGDNLLDTMRLIEDKKRYIQKKIEMYQDILQLMANAEDALDEKKEDTRPDKINQMITDIFNGLRGADNEK